MKPNDVEIIVEIYECQMCGDLAQLEALMMHLGCWRDHEYGKNPAAIVRLKRIVMQPLEYAI